MSDAAENVISNEVSLKEILQVLLEVKERLEQLEGKKEIEKEWFTPDEVAAILKRKPYTVRMWSLQKRIISRFDETNRRRWIPASEVKRLQATNCQLLKVDKP